ncbi:phage tail tape measure protein [Clostridium perfringens]
MKEMAQELKKVGSSYNLANTQAKLFGSRTDLLKSQQAELTAKMKIQNNMIKTQGDHLTKLNGDLDKQKSKQSELSKKIEDTTKKYKDSVEATGKNSKESKELSKELKMLKEEYSKNDRAIDSNISKLNNAEIKLNNSKKALEENKKALENINKELDKSKIDKFSDKIEKAGEKAGKISDKMKPISAGILGVGVASGKMAMDFEDGMAKVSTIADTSKVSMDELRKGVLRLSSDTGKSATEMSEGLYQALSASVDTSDAINFMGTATKAAVGGFTDTATAVDGLSTVLNSYGIKAIEADKIANQMLITQNLGKTTFGELASSVGKVTPISSQLNISTKELFSSLASTTAQGLATAESVTALKAAMSNIIKPSKEAADAADELGIKFNVSELKSKGWMPFLQEVKKGLEDASPALKDAMNAMEKASKKMTALEKAGKTNSKEYKQAKKDVKNFKDELEMLSKMSDSPISAMATMFGSVEGLNSILMLTSENGMNIYNQSMNQMTNNSNALNDAYDKIANTTQYKFKGALNQGKNAMIELGDSFAPFISIASIGISSISKAFNGLSDGTKKTIAIFGGLFIGTNLVLSGFSKLSKGIKGNIKFTKDMIKTTKNGVSKLKDFGKATKEGTNIVGKFGKSIISGTKTVANFTKAIILNTASGVKNGAIWVGNKVKMLAYKTAQLAVTGATKAMTLAQKGLNIVMAMNPIVLVIGLLVALGATFVILYNKCEWFRNGVNNVWSSITSTFTKFDNFFTGIFTRDWTENLGLLGVPLNSFLGTVGAIWNGVKGIFNGILTFLHGVFTGNWEEIFQGLGDIVKSIFGTIGGVIKAPINAAISGINWVISKINTISFDVPSWIPGIGGSHFGINLPTIPALAEGGIVTKATMALVGEGKEHEAVIPLSKLDKLVTSSVKAVLNSYISKKDRYTPIEGPKIFKIIVPVDGKVLAEVIVDSNGNVLTKKSKDRAIVRGEIAW